MVIPRVKNLPYKKVSNENNLDFSRAPEQALMAQLTRYSVPKAAALVSSLKAFLLNQQLSGFIDVLLSIAQPKDQLRLVMGRSWLDGAKFSLSEVRPLLAPIPRPILECYSTEKFDKGVAAAADHDTNATKHILKNTYRYEVIPDYDSWIENPVNILSFLDQSEADILDPAASLFSGEVVQFLEQVILLTTGLDITESTTEQDLLRKLTITAFRIPIPGY